VNSDNGNHPDVCIECQRRIDRLCAQPMLHARAVGTLIDAMYSAQSTAREEAVLLGFMAVFHPAMPAQQVTEVLLATRK
jgi:hypothetical protein